ncbi:hypothetical protein D3C81_1303190 [compost metagenome]
MQGQLGQFAIGLGQRLGKVGGPGFQARIEDRGQQGDAQYRQGGDQDQVVEAIAAQAIDGCAAKTALRKLRGGHAGVVHADNGDAHDHGGATTDQSHMRRVLAQVKGNPQRGARSAHGDQQGSAKQRRVVIDPRLHAHRRHAGVMHRADPCAHHQRAEPQLPGR